MGSSHTGLKQRLILKEAEKMEKFGRLDAFCIGTADFYNRYGRE